MQKLDLVKKFKSYYSAKPKPTVIDVEEAQFLSIAGIGDPSSEAFSKRISALYSVVYTLKFASKEKGKDFVVAKLEGLWWFNEKKYSGLTVDEVTVQVPRSEWNWRLLIRLPDFIKETDVDRAKTKVMVKKQLPHVEEVELFVMKEGKAVQILHVGSFADEPRSLALITSYMNEHNLVRAGVHHEIYLSDFNRTPPEKLRTILREPCRQQAGL